MQYSRIEVEGTVCYMILVPADDTEFIRKIDDVITANVDIQCNTCKYQMESGEVDICNYCFNNYHWRPKVIISRDISKDMDIDWEDNDIKWRDVIFELASTYQVGKDLIKSAYDIARLKNKR